MVAHPDDHRKLWLENMVKDNNFTVGVELGVHEGVTFRHMVDSCPNLTWHGIDLWTHKEVFKQWYNTLREDFKGNTRANLIKESTFTAHKHFDNLSIDVVFIDADHKYESVKKDIINWLPKVKPGGYICGHDINQHWVQQAVTETIKTYSTGPDLIWYKQVR